MLANKKIVYWKFACACTGLFRVIKSMSDCHLDSISLSEHATRAFHSIASPYENTAPHSMHAVDCVMCISACLCSINTRLYTLNGCFHLVFWHLGILMAPVNVSTNPQLSSSTCKTFAWANVWTAGVYCEFPAKNMPLLCIVLCGMIITHSLFA